MSFQPSSKIVRINNLLCAAGATDVLFVGGFVRDLILGIPSKDIDLEIYGLTYPQILDALRPAFHLGQVGQSFSVIKVDNEIDLAIPRRERKTGTGHKAFEVEADSTLTFREAAARRDFTINAIGMRLDGTFCDPYDGVGDLKRRILRAPTEAFCEDPLRVLRGMQFAARFGFEMEPRTVEFCRRVRPEFPTLSAERLYTEFEKWATKGRFPEKGLDVLRETTWIECFPELASLTDSWDVTRRACVSAAKIAQNQNLSHEEHLILLLAALLQGVAEAPDAQNFLMRMRAPLWVSDEVTHLVRSRDFAAHTAPAPSVIRHFAVDLAPSSIRMWNFFASAVWNGQNSPTESATGTAAGPSTETAAELHFKDWVESAEKLNAAQRPPEPLLFGRDLIPFGIPSGKKMGEILRAAWNAQLDGVFETHEQGVRWLEQTYKKS